MKTYLVMAFSAPEADTTEHEGGGDMSAWKTWMEKVGEGLVDMGAPLAFGVEGSGNGGFNKIKADQWPAHGYMMIQAADMDAAETMMKDSPLGNDMPLRIFEKAEMPDMG